MRVRLLFVVLAPVASAALIACGGSSNQAETLPTPQLLKAVAGAGHQVMVSWAPVAASGLDHYVIYWRAPNGPPTNGPIKVPLPDTGRVIPRLAPGTYHFAVEAVDAAGRASPRSSEVSATVAPAPQSAIPLGTDGAPNGYYEYLPPGYGDGVPRPLLIFSHGSGAGGNGSFDLDILLGCCPPAMVNEGTWSTSLPFVVLSPQSSLTQTLSDCRVGEEIHSFLAWALAHYTVDPKRIYLTGMSCGAIRIWNYLGNHTDQQVAAAWLLAGDPGSAWTQAGCDLGKVAIWAFHGTDDANVPIGPEQAVMQSLMACPAPPRKDVVYTVVQGAGHEVAWETFAGTAGTDALNWLLAHSKP